LSCNTASEPSCNCNIDDFVQKYIDNDVYKYNLSDSLKNSVFYKESCDIYKKMAETIIEARNNAIENNNGLDQKIMPSLVGYINMQKTATNNTTTNPEVSIMYTNFCKLVWAVYLGKYYNKTKIDPSTVAENLNAFFSQNSNKDYVSIQNSFTKLVNYIHSFKGVFI